jgi:hypothetical protein
MSYFKNTYISGSVAIRQDVVADNLNSFSGSLAASGSFTGGSVSTLNIVGIQVSAYMNQNGVIYIQQSPDGTNWDISDAFDYHTSINNFGVTVQAINSYYRVIVKNTSSGSASTCRLQSALCPIVEVVPRSLTQSGNLKVGIQEFEDNYGFGVENTPNDELRTVTPYRLVGSLFSGSVIDDIFWTTGSGSGSIVVGGGQAVLSTGSQINAGISLQSFRNARYIGGSSNRARIVMRLPDTGTTNNIRRWGAFTLTDGAFFELNGTTLKVITRKNSSDTAVDSGSFNGDMGLVIAIPTEVRTWEIYFNNSKVYFAINGVLLHTVAATSTTWSSTVSLPLRFENSNGNGSTSVVQMNVRNAVITRLGSAVSQPISYCFPSAQTAGINLKIGAGNLHSIIITGTTNNSVISLADSTSGSSPLIYTSTSTATTGVPVSLDFKGLPFYNGLRLIITAANSGATIIYE